MKSLNNSETASMIADKEVWGMLCLIHTKHQDSHHMDLFDVDRSEVLELHLRIVSNE